MKFVRKASSLGYGSCVPSTAFGAVHPSGRLALSVCRGGGLRMWNLVRGRCCFRTRLPSLARIVQYAPFQGATYALGYTGSEPPSSSLGSHAHTHPPPPAPGQPPSSHAVQIHSAETGALICSLPVSLPNALCLHHLQVRRRGAITNDPPQTSDACPVCMTLISSQSIGKRTGFLGCVPGGLHVGASEL